jgi:hypothetical protein
MFASKAGSLPKSGAPKRCFKLLGTSLAPNHYTRLEMLSRHKRSILIGTFANYSLKKFNIFAPGVNFCVGLQTTRVDKVLYFINRVSSCFLKY